MRYNNGISLAAACAASMGAGALHDDNIRALMIPRRTPSKKRNATHGFAVQGDVFNQPKSKRAKRRSKHKRK